MEIVEARSDSPKEYPETLSRSARYRGLVITLLGLALGTLFVALVEGDGLLEGVIGAIFGSIVAIGIVEMIRYRVFIQKMRSARWIVQTITRETYSLYHVQVEGAAGPAKVEDVSHELERIGFPVTAVFPRARYRRRQRDFGRSVILHSDGLARGWPLNLPWRAAGL